MKIWRNCEVETLERASMMVHIVVLGAGYAGLTTVLQLQKKVKKKDVSITLINKHRYHYQTTWLHRCAVGLYEESSVRIDIDSVIDKEVVTFKKELVEHIEPKLKQVKTEIDTYKYDYLVVALGAEINLDEIPGLSTHAHSIVTLARANRLYNRLLTVISDYKNAGRTDQLNIVVGGGGFTGVELVGELKEQLPQMLEQHHINKDKVTITLIEKEPTILPEFNLELGEYALGQLEANHIVIQLQTSMKEVGRHSVKVEQGGIILEIPHDLFIWTAGVSMHSVIKSKLFQKKSGELDLTDALYVTSHPDIFIIGDAAQKTTIHKNDKILPNADAAIQKGKYCAKYLIALINREATPKAFVFKAYGSRIASIGSRDAIGLLWNKRKVVGVLASVLKRITDHIVVLQMGGISFWYHVFFGKK